MKACRLFILFYLLQACTFHIPAEDISQLQAGKTFTRQGGFMIGPGDEIDIVVYGEEKLSGRFTVSPAGILTFPLIAPINVIGMTASQLTKRLESALDSMVKNPRVTAALLGVRSFSVYFAGEISRIGVVPLTSETTFFASDDTGGWTDGLRNGTHRLIRQVGNNKVRRFSLRYEDILTGEKYIDNITLESGDVIYVE